MGNFGLSGRRLSGMAAFGRQKAAWDHCPGGVYGMDQPQRPSGYRPFSCMDFSAAMTTGLSAA